MRRPGCACADEETVAAGCARVVEDVAAGLRGTSGGRRRLPMPGTISVAYSPRSSARMAGSWPSRPATATRGASSACSTAISGMRTPCATICGGTSSRHWATHRRCSRWTRPASSSKAGIRPGWPDSIVERWASGPTVRWGLPGLRQPEGYAGLDRALYLRRSGPTTACGAAGLPASRTPCPSAPSPSWRWRLLERALDGGVPAAWVVADEVYGSDSKFRALEARGQAYVVAVRTNQPVSTWPPHGPPAPWTVVAAVAAALTTGVTTWERHSCGDGVHGPRVYDWVYRPVRPALHDGWVHAVLVRRHPERLEEPAYSRLRPRQHAARRDPPAAGARWTIEETFKLAKGQVGLDQYEVRRPVGLVPPHHPRPARPRALTIGVGQKGDARALAPPARSTSRSRSPSSAGSSSASSGGSPSPRPPSPRSSPGPAGGAATRRSPKPATESVA